MKCKISIIVPVYKVEQYIDDCIKSILSQTLKDFELILVNDGSPDKCGLICDMYSKKDSRVRVIHKNNEGLSAARNSGIEVAKGEYLAFVDSDDYISKYMYEKLYNTAVENKSDIVICNYESVHYTHKLNYELLEHVDKVENMSNIQALNKLYETNGVAYIVAWNKLYKKELFDNIRYDKGRVHEDEFIIHKLLYNSNIITYIPDKLYYYRQREGSITSIDNKKNRVDKLAAFKERLEFMYEKNIDYLVKKTAQKYIYHFFEIYYSIKNNYDSKNYNELVLLRKDYNKVLHIVLKNIDCNWKEKILLVVFAINPYLHELYRNKRIYSREKD